MNLATDCSPYPQTRFFQACRGVFEGGGTRGAAHVGAFQAAVLCGVNFSEVAGTSAGSIVAALVGAGATPDYLLEKVAGLKFNSLLSEPKRQIATPWLARFGGAFFRGKKRLLGKIAQNGSAYSSERIQQWMDERLAELLPHIDGPVKFKDLPLPTWIVATDLSGRRAKVWSKQQTPDENVAFAVRCSCSIPLFFEPVQAGLDLYVDGGMLSNLPSFVFADERMDARALGGRILAFRLEENSQHSTNRNIDWLIRRLIDTAISGATKIQGALLDNVSTVLIPTGQISSINFDISNSEIETLLASGRSAVRNFIQNEHSGLDDALSGDVARWGEDELFDDLTREMAVCGSRLLVSCDDTRWFWKLFPSVAHWAFGGAAIEVLVGRGIGDKREQHRRELMRSLGVRFKSVDSLPFTGFILNRSDDRHDAAFITNISHTQYSPTGTVYIGVNHRTVIKTMTGLLEKLIALQPVQSHQLRLELGDTQRLADLMKLGVNQYADANVTLSLERIDLRSVNPRVRLIVQRVRSFKYRQMEALVALYDRFNVPFGAPADIYADDIYVSTITPPVLELWGDDLIAIEGNTRMFYLNRMGVDAVRAFVVRGVSLPLPGRPVDMSSALISTYQLSPDDRISGFCYANFRSIEGAVRPEE